MKLRNLMPLALVAALAACSDAGADGATPPASDPPAAAPAANEVLPVAETFELDHLNDAVVVRRDWEVEVEYDTSATDGVFDFYDGWLVGEGFARVALEEDGDEYEAAYERDDLRVELEIDDEDDDDGVEVDFDLSDRARWESAPPAFTGTAFDGLEFAFYERDLIDEIEWDFRVVYDPATTTAQEAFDFHDAQLASQGWTRTETDDDEAEYRRDGVELDLEVDDEDDDGVEVEIELDKDRFYTD